MKDGREKLHLCEDILEMADAIGLDRGVFPLDGSAQELHDNFNGVGDDRLGESLIAILDWCYRYVPAGAAFHDYDWSTIPLKLRVLYNQRRWTKKKLWKRSLAEFKKSNKRFYKNMVKIINPLWPRFVTVRVLGLNIPVWRADTAPRRVVELGKAAAAYAAVSSSRGWSSWDDNFPAYLQEGKG